jgi:hypothetical protein
MNSRNRDRGRRTDVHIQGDRSTLLLVISVRYGVGAPYPWRCWWKLDLGHRNQWFFRLCDYGDSDCACPYRKDMNTSLAVDPSDSDHSVKRWNQGWFRMWVKVNPSQIKGKLFFLPFCPKESPVHCLSWPSSHSFLSLCPWFPECEISADIEESCNTEEDLGKSSSRGSHASFYRTCRRSHLSRSLIITSVSTFLTYLRR